jgi:hypothetical protein
MTDQLINQLKSAFADCIKNFSYCLCSSPAMYCPAAAAEDFAAGARALEKLREKIDGVEAWATLSDIVSENLVKDQPYDATLFDEFQRKLQKGKGVINWTEISSCSRTAAVLGYIMCDVRPGNQADPVPEWGKMKENHKVDKIAELLNSPKMVGVQLSPPDHHFIVFPTGTDKVVILQGFQDVYNLYDWMTKAHNGGVMAKDEFVRAMRDLGDPKRKLAAAVKLFSYEDENAAVPVDWKISEHYLNEEPIQVKNIGTKTLDLVFDAD